MTLLVFDWLGRYLQPRLDIDWLCYTLTGLVRLYVTLLVFDWLGRHLQPRLDIDWFDIPRLAWLDFT